MNRIIKQLDYVFTVLSASLNIYDDLEQWFEDNAYFAGGCIYSLVNGDKPKDYDIFFKDISRIDELKKNLKDYGCNYFETDYAITYYFEFLKKKYTIQFITKYHGEPDKCVGEFDFLHNMYYYVPYSHSISSVNDEFNSLYSKVLMVNKTRARDMEGVFLRIGKYRARGFVVDDDVPNYVLSCTTWAKIDEYREARRKTFLGEHY